MENEARRPGGRRGLMSFEKYVATHYDRVRTLMVGAAAIGRWYTLEQLSAMTELSTEQVGRAFLEIRKGPYKILRRRRAGKYECQIESLRWGLK